MLLTILTVGVVGACEGDENFSGLGIATDAVSPRSGNLQVFFLDVGQGDGILVVSPMGQTVMIDGGGSQCAKVVEAMDSLGVGDLDYLIASHYHQDHIGCTPDILARREVTKAAFDRGDSVETASFGNKCYSAYIEAVGEYRQTADLSTPILLDDGNVWRVLGDNTTDLLAQLNETVCQGRPGRSTHDTIGNGSHDAIHFLDQTIAGDGQARIQTQYQHPSR